MFLMHANAPNHTTVAHFPYRIHPLLHAKSVELCCLWTLPLLHLGKVENIYLVIVTLWVIIDEIQLEPISIPKLAPNSHPTCCCP